MSTCSGTPSTWTASDFSALIILLILLLIVMLIGLVFLIEILIRSTIQKTFRRLFHCSIISCSIQIICYIASYFTCNTHSLYAIGLAAYATNCALVLAVLIYRLRSVFQGTLYQLSTAELSLLITSYLIMSILILSAFILMLYNALSMISILFYAYLPALLLYTGLSMMSSLLYINNLLRLSNECRASASLNDLSNIKQLKEIQIKLQIASKYISLLLFSLFSTATLMLSSAISSVSGQRIAYLLISINSALNMISLYLHCSFVAKYYVKCCCCLHAFWKTFLMFEHQDDIHNIAPDEVNPLSGDEEGSDDTYYSNNGRTNGRTDAETGLNAHRTYEILLQNGFEQRYIKRALCIHTKHYGRKYDIKTMEEIIYRLKIKDKVKETKEMQNLYQSREDIEAILKSLNVASKYIDAAITLFEIMADILEIEKYHEFIYDLEIITEMTMRLRAKAQQNHDTTMYETDGKVTGNRNGESDEKLNDIDLTVSKWHKVTSISDDDTLLKSVVDDDDEQEEIYIHDQGSSDPNEILQNYWKMYSKASSGKLKDES